MSILRSTVILSGVLLIAGGVSAQDFKKRFVGKSACAPELQSDHVDFSLPLDKTQDLNLIHRYWDAAKVVLLIESKGDSHACGVIRDVIQIPDVAQDFEFRCVDPRVPENVIIGTSIRNGRSKPLIAIKAWRINLKEQKFETISHKVRCTNEGWSGDDGSNMVEEGKKRASQQKPTRNARATRP